MAVYLSKMAATVVGPRLSDESHNWGDLLF